MDEDFLDEVMGAVDGVGAVDEFVGQLWKGWKQVRDEDAVVQVSSGFLEIACSGILMSSVAFAIGTVSLRLLVAFDVRSSVFEAGRV